MPFETLAKWLGAAVWITLVALLGIKLFLLLTGQAAAKMGMNPAKYAAATSSHALHCELQLWAQLKPLVGPHVPYPDTIKNLGWFPKLAFHSAPVGSNGPSIVNYNFLAKNNHGVETSITASLLVDHVSCKAALLRVWKELGDADESDSE